MFVKSRCLLAKDELYWRYKLEDIEVYHNWEGVIKDAPKGTKEKDKRLIGTCLFLKGMKNPIVVKEPTSLFDEYFATVSIQGIVDNLGKETEETTG